ncbi:MAG: tetratricopeptide repeat protein [Euryarchaeota archaeon]|nr:tetratricopeptide repeat protein [Euryarchaeota archaeon]
MRRVPVARHLAATGIADEEDVLVATIEGLLDRRVKGAAGGLWDLTAPLPSLSRIFEGRVSPRMALLLAKALDVPPGGTVLLAGDPLVFVAAALLSLPETHRPSQVVVVSAHPARAMRSAERMGRDIADHPDLVVLDLHAMGLLRPRVEVRGGEGPKSDNKTPAIFPRDGFDRTLLYGGSWSPHTADAYTAPDGRAVLADPTPGKLRFVQRIRVKGDTAEVDLVRHRFATDVTPPASEGPLVEPVKRMRMSGTRVGRILLAEHLLAHVWHDAEGSRMEQGVRKVVEETFSGNDYAHALDPRRYALARRLFHLAYMEQSVGDLVAAEALYRASLSVCETAEGWTFYGWVRSMRGALDEAIDACRRAIMVDPMFGNPYNDIGAYLLERGDRDSSKTWFHRAAAAPRYAAPYYPFLNLGRVYLSEGDLEAARGAVQRALEVAPGYPPAERLLQEIEARESHDPHAR